MQRVKQYGLCNEYCVNASTSVGALVFATKVSRKWYVNLNKPRVSKDSSRLLFRKKKIPISRTSHGSVDDRIILVPLDPLNSYCHIMPRNHNSRD